MCHICSQARSVLSLLGEFWWVFLVFFVVCFLFFMNNMFQIRKIKGNTFVIIQNKLSCLSNSSQIPVSRAF